MVAATPRKRVAAYAPASTLSQFFDHIRYVREPSEVDSGLLQDYGVKASHAFALLSTLKFLGLIDDRGKPTPVFRELQTGGEEFREALKGVLQHAYKDLFDRLEVSRDTKDKIVNFFARNYSPATAEKATRLFLDLCGEAGIATASQPRMADPNSAKSRPSASRAISRTAIRRRQTPPAAEDPVRNRPEDPPDGNAGPRIDIRINSQDLAAMTPEQIAAMFDGIARIYPHLPSTTEFRQAGEPPGGPDKIEGLTDEAVVLLEKVESGGVPAYMTPNLRRIAEENGVEVSDSNSPNEVIDALQELAQQS